jgi:hypothetical protein
VRREEHLHQIQHHRIFVRGAITKEDTFLGTKLKFSGIVRPKMRPTCTTKGLKPSIVWFGVGKLLKGRDKIDDMRGKMIYKISGTGEDIIPKF